MGARRKYREKNIFACSLTYAKDCTLKYLEKILPYNCMNFMAGKSTAEILLFVPCDTTGMVCGV